MNLEKFQLENDVISALRTVHDPEIPVNIYDLGLIYSLQVSDNHAVDIVMTLTSPNCPIAEDMPGMVRQALSQVQGIGTINVNLTFEPPWDMDKLTDEAKLELGML